VRITLVDLDVEVTAWLSAVGLYPGEQIVVLRRAAVGGPLHLKVLSGGEFAVARDLARDITVEDVAA
jgi:ferrous iron transport protein A